MSPTSPGKASRKDSTMNYSFEMDEVSSSDSDSSAGSVYEVMASKDRRSTQILEKYIQQKELMTEQKS